MANERFFPVDYKSHMVHIKIVSGKGFIVAEQGQKIYDEVTLTLQKGYLVFKLAPFLNNLS